MILVVYWRCPCAGAAPTFLCRPQRKVGKRKRLTPLILKWVPWLGGGSGASGIGALAHSALVTQQSFFRRRCARRRGASSLRFGVWARRSRRLPRRENFHCFPGQTRSRRTQCGELMTAWSLTRNMTNGRSHRWTQMGMSRCYRNGFAQQRASIAAGHSHEAPRRCQ